MNLSFMRVFSGNVTALKFPEPEAGSGPTACGLIWADLLPPREAPGSVPESMQWKERPITLIPCCTLFSTLGVLRLLWSRHFLIIYRHCLLS